MSQIWFGGIGAGGGAFGAGEAYPDFVHSVRAQFCPIPQAIFPRAILTHTHTHTEYTREPQNKQGCCMVWIIEVFENVQTPQFR